jgi:hypothetical protein
MKKFNLKYIIKTFSNKTIFFLGILILLYLTNNKRNNNNRDINTRIYMIND